MKIIYLYDYCIFMIINVILISQNFLNYNLKFFIVKIVVKINAHANARVKICVKRVLIHKPTCQQALVHAPKRMHQDTRPKQKNSRHGSAVLFVQNSNEAAYGRVNAVPRTAR